MICVKCKREVPDAPYCCQCGARQEKAPRRTKRANGTGYVYKRGKYWYAQVTTSAGVEDKGGKRRCLRRTRTKGGFATKTAALLFIDELRASEVRKVPTLLDLWELYKDNDLPRLSESKQIGYKKARDRLEPIIKRKIDSLTTADLQGVVNENSSSFYTARDMKVLLSHFYKRALADQFVTVNLSQFITLPELEEKESVPFTPQEVSAMWKAYADGEIFLGYLLLMIYTGMMPGELFACKKSMIDFDKCEIYGCGKKTKKRKTSVIIFPEIVKPVLEALCAWTEGDKLQPQYETEWYDRYHETLKKIGVRDLPPYSCRHTTGTEAAKLNLTAPVIQKIMRHAKITTSQRYIHLGEADARAGINSLPGALPSS